MGQKAPFGAPTGPASGVPSAQLPHSPTAASAVVPIPGTFSWPLAARGKPRRGMLRRAVFSDVQRKALEKMFQKQKYISKPDRKKLAAKLGLKDSQVSGVMVGKGGEKSRGWVEGRRGEGGMGEGRAARGRSELRSCECWPEPREQRDSQLGQITAGCDLSQLY